jgi:hypothetical protein
MRLCWIWIAGAMRRGWFNVLYCTKAAVFNNLNISIYGYIEYVY